MTNMLKALKQLETVPPHVQREVERTPDHSPQEKSDPVQTAASEEPTVDRVDPETISHEAAHPDESPSVEQEAKTSVHELLGPREEHYRSLTENIHGQLPSGRATVLLLAGLGNAEHDDAILAPLAATLAERIAAEVLIVDGRFGRSESLDRLAVGAKRGLADVLSAKVDWREAVSKTVVQGLSVLAGAKPAAGDDRLRQPFDPTPLLGELRRHFRLVIVATNSPAGSYTSCWARHCDGVFLIVRLGQTPRRAAERAIRTIEQSGGRVLGCILTDV